MQVEKRVQGSESEVREKGAREGRRESWELGARAFPMMSARFGAAYSRSSKQTLIKSYSTETRWYQTAFSLPTSSSLRSNEQANPRPESTIKDVL